MVDDSSKNLAEGKLPEDKKEIHKHQLDAARNTNTFRIALFALSFVVISAFYIAFLYYVFCKSLQDEGHERLILSAIIGTIPTILLMAMARQVFSPIDKENKESDGLSIWQNLAKESIEVFKEYIRKK